METMREIAGRVGCTFNDVQKGKLLLGISGTRDYSKDRTLRFTSDEAERLTRYCQDVIRKRKNHYSRGHRRETNLDKLLYYVFRTGSVDIPLPREIMERVREVKDAR